ncbi:hypothetical protein BEN78_03755 [Xanthomonas citri pv. mangiferaeindicae]|nr:hypothetical protein BEN78_03755 [Xanthomonas citri pv. mangiferaeindicae]
MPALRRPGRHRPGDRPATGALPALRRCLECRRPARADGLGSQSAQTAPRPRGVADGDDVRRGGARAARRADAQGILPAPDDASRTVPSFARSRVAAASPRARRWLWVAAVGLALLLVLQGLFAERARLAAHPAWRPALERLCGALGCALPPWREPAALALLARDVRAEPEDPTRLQVSAAFRNDARWPQAWPQLRLVLSDIDGHVIGSRVFTAQEYLGGAPPAPTLAPGATAHVRLTLEEPGPGAVSFAFELL